MTQAKRKFAVEMKCRKYSSPEIHFYSKLQVKFKDQASTISSPKVQKINQTFLKTQKSDSNASKGSIKSEQSKKSKYSQGSILKKSNMFEKINKKNQNQKLDRLKQQKQIQLFEVRKTVGNCKLRVKRLKQQIENSRNNEKLKIRNLRKELKRYFKQ